MTAAPGRNPIFDGWYADPDVQIFRGEYWIYPTASQPPPPKPYLDAFSSKDLVTWTKHPRVLDEKIIEWATHAMWAPCAVEKDGKFYLFFSANDVHPGEIGGIGVAVADHPGGPFRDHLGKPLINEIENGAQPIDQCVFKDRDGRWYIVYGGWGHCNLAKLNDDFTALVPFEDGRRFHEITPQGYVEGPLMFRREGKVYFMWSEGAWTNASYQVAYAIGDSVEGPFRRIGTVIEKNPAIASGAGHHSVLHPPGGDDWYIVYHRRPAGHTARFERETCIDKMEFGADGKILPVAMTTEGVPARPLERERSAAAPQQ